MGCYSPKPPPITKSEIDAWILRTPVEEIANCVDDNGNIIYIRPLPKPPATPAPSGLPPMKLLAELEADLKTRR